MHLLRPLLAALALAAPTLSAGSSPIPGIPPPQRLARIPTGRLVVKLRALPSPPLVAEVAGQLSLQVVHQTPRSPYLLVRSKKGKVPAVPPALAGCVQYVEPEIKMFAVSMLGGMGIQGGEHREPGAARGVRPSISMPASASVQRPVPSGLSLPNDPYFLRQWDMQDGGFGIGLPAVRQRATGLGVVVAVVDTGVRQTVPDLAGTTFLTGYNAMTPGASARDDNGHGTHVCGTIAQATDNRLGCAGIAPAARILPVKVLNAQGTGTNFTIATGIRWAVDHGARVINLSLGGASSQTLRDAVQYAVNRGVTLCAAAGNGGGQGLIYPAGYPEVISVGAIDSRGQRASFSEWGNNLTLCAPGVEILQNTFNPRTGQTYYGSWDGTSMATPHVTGAVALLLQGSPGMTPADVKARLTGTARDLGAPGRDPYYGAGEIDLKAALAPVTAPAPEPAPEPAPAPGPVPSPAPPPDQPGPAPLPQPPAGLVDQILAGFNAERSRNGVAPVTLEPRLTAAAAAHCREMARRNVLSHTGANGSDPGQRMSQAGYPWSFWGEIIAMGQRDGPAVVQAWINSPDHHSIMIDARYTEVGIDVELTPDGVPYYCADWGRR